MKEHKVTLKAKFFSYDDLPPVTENALFAGQRVFDTWTDQLTGWNSRAGNNAIPLRIRVTGIQVKIRLFDPKENKLLTRQVTFQIPQ